MTQIFDNKCREHGIGQGFFEDEVHNLLHDVENDISKKLPYNLKEIDQTNFSKLHKNIVREYRQFDFQYFI